MWILFINLYLLISAQAHLYTANLLFMNKSILLIMHYQKWMLLETIIPYNSRL